MTDITAHKESEMMMVHITSTITSITYTRDNPETEKDPEIKAYWKRIHPLNLRIIYEDGWKHRWPQRSSTPLRQREKDKSNPHEEETHFSVLNLECTNNDGFQEECKSILQKFMVATINLLGPDDYTVVLIHPTTEDGCPFTSYDDHPPDADVCQRYIHNQQHNNRTQSPVSFTVIIGSTCKVFWPCSN